MTSLVTRHQDVSFACLPPSAISLNCQGIHTHPTSLHLESLVLYLHASAASAVELDVVLAWTKAANLQSHQLGKFKTHWMLDHNPCLV